MGDRSETWLCPGPHDEGQEPETDEPLCTDCQRALDRALTEMPELATRVYLALEHGTRPAPPETDRSDGPRRRDDGHAPLPLDGEADAMMRRLLDVLGCWHDVVQHHAHLSRVAKPRAVRHLRVASRYEQTVRSSDLPSLPGEEEGGKVVELSVRRGLQAVDRPNDSTTGVAISTACTLLRTHLHTLIRLERTPVMRRRRITELASIPDEALGSLVVTGADETTGEIEATHLLDLDGVDAAKEILDLRRSIRVFLGDTRGIRRTLPVPCPSVDPGPDGLPRQCGGALVIWNGTDHVECVVCRRQWSENDYERLQLVLAHEVLQQGTWKGSAAEDMLVTQARAAEIARVDAATVRSWVQRKMLTQAGRDSYGRPQFRLGDVLEVEERTRPAREARHRRNA